MSKTTQPSLSRRSFLKTTAAAAGTVGAAGVLSSCAPQQKKQETADTGAKPLPEIPKEDVYSGACRGGCAQGCYINYHVREGKVIRTSARDFCDPDYNRICIKGLSLPERIYSNDRLKTPLRRVGERGSGEWEQISWDEAIEEICSCMKRNMEEYGPMSIGHTFRTGQEGIVFQMVWNRFRNAVGGAVMRLAADRHFAKGLIDSIGYGGLGSSNDDADLVNARCILMVGANFTETFYQQWHWVYEAQKQGAIVITIDPNYTGIASKSDMWVPLRPATDSALFMAMCNVAIENDWVDWDFLKRQSMAPGLVRTDDKTLLRMKDVGGAADDERLVAISESTGAFGPIEEVSDPVMQGIDTQVEGIAVRSPWDIFTEAIAQYTPEYASTICDVPPETIEEITRIFCTHGPSSIKIGVGQDHRQFGYQHYSAQGIFSVITGMLAKEGCTNGYYSRSPGYNGKQMKLPEGVEGLGEVKSIAASQFDVFMETGKYGDIDIPMKVLFAEGTDFVHMRGDRLATLKALDNLDMLVSVNLVMNDTSLVADIVLPVCEWCEYEEISGNRSYTQFLQYQDKIQEPMYESKSDFEIVKLLLEGLGHPELFNWETPADLLIDYFGKDLYEQIKEEKCIYAPYYVERDYRYIYGEDGNWDTTTGKAQFYAEVPAHGIEFESYGQPEDPDRSRLPRFMPPAEAWNEEVEGFPKNELAAKYPLSIMAEHKKWNTQTCFSRSKIIRQLDPEPTLFMSEQDAADRGIVEGDYVRAFNDRGECVFLCHIHQGMRPGMVNMPNGWLADQYVLGSQIDISMDETDPDNESCNFSDALVEVEKYEGEVSRA